MLTEDKYGGIFIKSLLIRLMDKTDTETKLSGIYNACSVIYLIVPWFTWLCCVCLFILSVLPWENDKIDKYPKCVLLMLTSINTILITAVSQKNIE